MFCRFCGKEIQDDSDFCPYCGKNQSTQMVPPTYQQKKANTAKNKISISTLETIATIVFYVGIVGFLVLLFKMAPGVGSETVLSYIIIAVITIILSIIIHKIRDKKYTKKRQMIALLFGLLLLIPSIALRIVYEAKVDSVTANIPSSGTVCVQVKLDEEFFSYYYEGMVREPYSYITVDGRKYDGTTEFLIEMGKKYTVQIGAGYAGRSGVASSSASGKTTDTITLSPSNLKNGYTIKEQVNLDGGYADVTVKLVRVCTFWEVIFA